MQPAMAQRFSPYFLLVVSVIFIALLSHKMLGRWYVHHRFTEAEWIELSKIPIVLVAALIAVRGLRRSDQSKPKKTLRATVIDSADTLVIGFRRRPWLAVLVVVLLLAIPFTLLSLARGGNWTF